MSGHCPICGESVGPGVFRCTCKQPCEVCEKFATVLRRIYKCDVILPTHDDDSQPIDEGELWGEIRAALAAYDAARKAKP